MTSIAVGPGVLRANRLSIVYRSLLGEVFFGDAAQSWRRSATAENAPIACPALKGATIGVRKTQVNGRRSTPCAPPAF